jgi:hypothetical protein
MDDNLWRSRMNEVLNELSISTNCVYWGPNIIDFTWTCYLFDFYWNNGRRYLKVHCGDNTDVDDTYGPMCCECGEFPYSTSSW